MVDILETTLNSERKPLTNVNYEMSICLKLSHQPGDREIA